MVGTNAGPHNVLTWSLVLVLQVPTLSTGTGSQKVLTLSPIAGPHKFLWFQHVPLVLVLTRSQHGPPVLVSTCPLVLVLTRFPHGPLVLVPTLSPGAGPHKVPTWYPSPGPHKNHHVFPLCWSPQGFHMVPLNYSLQGPHMVF